MQIRTSPLKVINTSTKLDNAEKRVDLIYQLENFDLKVSTWHNTKEVLIFKKTEDSDWQRIVTTDSMFAAIAFILTLY